MIINPIDMWYFLDKTCPKEIPSDPHEQDELIRIIEQKLVQWLEDNCATQAQDAFDYVTRFIADIWTFMEPVGIDNEDGDEKEAKRMCLLFIVMQYMWLRDRTRDMR
jgi:hypothetical protein